MSWFPLTFPRVVAIFAPAILLTMIGCGSTPENLHPVEGRVAATGGDAATLAGQVIETRLATDPLVRSSAEIAPDGTFSLETLAEGQIVPGAFAGSHQVRIVLNEDDPESRRRAKEALDPRYLDFEKSGLVIDVPATAEPTLQFQLR